MSNVLGVSKKHTFPLNCSHNIPRYDQIDDFDNPVNQNRILAR